MESVAIVNNTVKSVVTNTRLHEVDFLRVSAIILVILYHTYRLVDLKGCDIAGNSALMHFKWALDHVITFFRMPLLIFVSGYMFAFLKIEKGKYENTSKLIKQKFKRLILPYIVFAPITFECYSLWKSDAIGTFLCPIGHLWFIVMLFWCFCFTQVLSKTVNLSDKSKFIPIFIFLFLVICYPLSFSFKDYFGLSSCLRWLWCFILGYGCSALPKSANLRNLKLNSIIVLLSSCIVGIITVAFVREINLKMAIFLHPIVMGLCVLTIWGLVFYAGMTKVPSLLSSMIKCSYGMYVVHMWILSAVFFNIEYVMEIANGNLGLLSFILFISVTILSYIFSRVILKTRIGRYLIG